ncbi:MAG: hypothetical protein Q9166_005537 [cf. Caloplaca sp. 2 TL-2023]
MAFRSDDDPYPLSLPTMDSPDTTAYRSSSIATADDLFGAPYPDQPMNDFDSFDIENVFPNAILSPRGDYGSILQSTNIAGNHSHSSESSPGSSSTSSIQHRRHVSSNSSRSATYETDRFVPTQAQMRKSNTGSSAIGMDAAQRTSETSTTDNDLDRQMNELFDFDSAANSPGDSVMTGTSSERPIPGMAIPQHQPSPQESERKSIQPGGHPHTTGSRSVVSTPSSFKPESSWQPPPPHTQPFEFRPAPAFKENTLYTPPYGTSTAPPLAANAGFVGPNDFGYPPPMFIPPAVTFRSSAQSGRLMGPRLMIEPIAPKTRVETQIPVKMTFDPLPPGITKLHLPARTMAKSKLIAKPHPSRSPDMLELDVMPVCASAMKKPELCQRAFALARGERLTAQLTHQAQRSSSEGPPNGGPSNEKIEPMNGGPISICDGCVTRERKRANRRIEKEETAEDIMWKQGEKERIVVFNETEVVEWKPYGSADVNEPAGKRAKGAGGRAKKKGEPAEEASTPTFAPGPSMPYAERRKQIRLMMRITCYCRHQGEAEGFQVILTLKDHLGNCVAQQISTPILITDDHKASALQNEGPSPTLTDGPHHPSGGFFDPPAPSFSAGGGPYLFNPSHSHSTTELPSHPFSHSTSALYRPSTSVSLHQLGHHQAQRSTGASTPSKISSYRTSATPTPRNLSRQVSPTATSGPTPKRRKAGGSFSFHYRPLVDLSMTRMQTTDATADHEQRSSLSPSSSSDASEGLTMAPTAAPAHASPAALPSSSSMASSNAAPSNLETVPDMSASHGSGTQSPQPAQHASDTDIAAHAQALRHSLLNVSGAVVPPALAPMVLRAIPSEGPTSGGIDVTILGQDFHNGLDVLFADAVATNTIVINRQTIVCTIPPSFQAGLVRVTLRGRHQPEPRVCFRYVDTDEEDLMRLALSVLHHRNTGKFANAGEVARSIINGQQSQGNLSNGTQHLQNSFRAMDLELSILSLIDLIDQADTSIAPRYNLYQSNGQTMLHLSASLGYHRLVAGLLARGANPDLRDRNGMSAMHMACLHGHTKVVRKLLSAGGDPTVRSLLGLAPIDMATTHAVYQIISSIERHTRSRSLGATPISHLSRSSSLASIASTRATRFSENINMGDVDLALNSALAEAYRSRPVTPAQVWARSRRNSAAEQQPFLPDQSTEDAASDTQIVTAAAAMAAWRDNLAGQIHYFQQSVQRTLPNLQVPNLPPLPTFEAYQEHPMVRRISSLVPRMHAAPAPPSYDEIYPEQSPGDVKKASTARAIGDAVIDTKCAMTFDTTTASSPSLMRAIGEATTKEQQEELRLAHARNVKKLSNDRKLFFVWIPLLILVVVAMLKDWVPEVVRGVRGVVGFVQEYLAA